MSAAGCLAKAWARFERVIDVEEGIAEIVVPVATPGPVTVWPTARPAVLSMPVTVVLPEVVVPKPRVERVALYWFAAPAWLKYSS